MSSLQKGNIYIHKDYGKLVLVKKRPYIFKLVSSPWTSKVCLTKKEIQTLKLHTSTIGLKYDKKKVRWDLLLWDDLEEIAKVLTHGAKKYGDYNWQNVDNFEARYEAALLRHLHAYRKARNRNKVAYDKESNQRHLAHAACCLLFLMWKERQTINRNRKNK